MSSAPTEPNPPAPKKSRAKRWLRRTTWAFIIAVVVYLATPTVLSLIISYKLRAEIADRLNATLIIGKLTYRWPYDVVIQNARLTSDSTSSATPLFDVSRLEIQLANLPLGQGPLIIKKVDIRDPLVYLIKKPPALNPPSFSATPSTTNEKLSDLFQLERLTISGARIQYDDRSKPTPKPPLIWSKLQADLRTVRESPSKYQFKFVADSPPLAEVRADGNLDIDTLLLNVAHLSVIVQSQPNHRAEQLPPPIQAICEKFKIAGQVKLNAVAQVPLNDFSNGVYAAELRLDNGSCQLPGWSAPINPVELRLNCSNGIGPVPSTLPTTLPAHSPDLLIELSSLKIASGPQTFQLQTAQARINKDQADWAIGHIVGTAEIGNGPGPVQAVGIAAHIPFAATGHGSLNTHDVLIRLQLDNARATVPPKNMPLDPVTATLTINPHGLTLTHLACTIFDGDATLSGNLNWDDLTRGITYAGHLDANKINARDLSNHIMSEKKIRDIASGTGEIHLAFNGSFPPHASAADAFTANGDLDIRHGHFLNIPILKDVLGEVNRADTATVGEAAATFTIDHSQVHFLQAAANAPALGVIGEGDLAFDGTVDMGFVVTPLADWREKLASTDIPVVSSIGATLVGQAQNVVNATAKTILYQYRVTGPITHPKTQTVPAPALTDAMKSLFQEMSGDTEEDALTKRFHRNTTTSSPSTRPSH